MRLVDKRIVVTGASGIAAAGVRLSAAEGARIFVVSKDETECRELTENLPGSGYAVADLTEEEASVAAFVGAVDHLGGIDGLFAVAGGSGRAFGDGPLHETELDGWSRTHQMNSDPMFLAAREAIRSMRGGSGGSVVLVGSVLATRPVPGLFATHSYAAVKGAANSLAVSLAAYYAPDSIRVNVIAPGLVDTPMAARAAADPSIVAYATRKQPLAGGLLGPDDVARAAIFLLSDESRQITGQVIAVDGGWSVTEV